MTNFIFYTNPTLTLLCVPATTRARHTLDAAAELTGVHPEMLRYYCRLGLLGGPGQPAEHPPTFSDDELYELRRIEHYRRQHGVSRQALPLFCALSREVDRLQAELRFLRGP